MAHPSTADYEARLAELAIRVGVDVEPGQDVFILVFDVEQAPLARAIADAAYRAGAGFVSVLYWDQHVKRSRLLHADPETLGEVPDWWERHIAECVERRGAYIVVWGDPDPNLLADVDPERGGAEQMPLVASLLAAQRGGEIAWLFMPGPCPGIARRLLGAPDVARLWEIIAPIVRIDADDPVRAWDDHLNRLRERAALLDERGFEALHFAGLRHRPDGGAAGIRPLDDGRADDRAGAAKRRQPAHRGGVHDARPPADRGRRTGDRPRPADRRRGR